MLEKQQKLEISREQLDVIESALHTQSKILYVQADAGGSGARAKLNEVKRVLAHLASQKPTDKHPAGSLLGGWFGVSRLVD